MNQQPLADSASAPAATGAAEVAQKSKKAERSRGSDTMFRIVYQNHISLSQLADSKANMLININGLIISVMIALVVPRIDSLSWRVSPAVVLVIGCLVSLAFAVIAARPRVPRAAVTSDDARNGTGNVLFFAHFTTMPLVDFQKSLRMLTKDRRLLYDHLARQLYEMGQSLDDKYRCLQLAYTAFLLGAVVATVAFVLTLLAGFLA